MTALTARRDTQSREAKLRRLGLSAGASVFAGGIVCKAADGYLVAASLLDGLSVAGVSIETVDNSAGADGDLYAKVQSGRAFLLAATSITKAMEGQVMYLVDDQTVDDQPGASSIPVGYLDEFVSSTSGWVRIPEGGMPADTETQSKSALQTLTGDAETISMVGGYDVNQVDAGGTARTGTILEAPDAASHGKVVVLENTGGENITLNATDATANVWNSKIDGRILAGESAFFYADNTLDLWVRLRKGGGQAALQTLTGNGGLITIGASDVVVADAGGTARTGTILSAPTDADHGRLVHVENTGGEDIVFNATDATANMWNSKVDGRLVAGKTMQLVGDSTLGLWIRQAYSGGEAALQTLTGNGETVTVGDADIVPIDAGGSGRTGTILSAPRDSDHGRPIWLENQGGEAIVFDATPGTSNLASAATLDEIDASISVQLVGDSTLGQWVPAGFARLTDAA